MTDVGTKAIEGTLDAPSAYAHSFGQLAHKTRYHDPWQIGTVEGEVTKKTVLDLRPAIQEKAKQGFAHQHEKALGPTTGGAGTAGYALVPVFVDPRIVDLSRKYTPLVEMIPRVTNLGQTADYNEITAKGSGFTANPDAPLTESDDTYNRQSVSIKYLYAVGRVLGPAQAAIPSYVLDGFSATGAGTDTTTTFTSAGAPNAKQLEVLVKARQMKELEESLIVNGDASTDATQFSGIVKLQGTTNQNDLSAAALTWDDIEDTIQLAFDDGGRPKLAVGSSAAINDLRKIMIDTFRWSPADTRSQELVFGVPSQLVIDTMVGPVVVIPSMYLSNVSGAKQIFFLDTDYIEMRVLQDMTYEDLAKTNDSQKFMLKIYECLIMRAPKFNAFIDNIA